MLNRQYIDMKSIKTISLTLLLGYMLFVLYRIVLMRKASANYRYQLEPFWSYDVNGGIGEGVLNVLLFIPIGILLSLCFKKQPWWMVALVGLLFSVIIELLQLVLRKGFCEFDDVFHNTLGCIIGYGICRLVIIIVHKV